MTSTCTDTATGNNAACLTRASAAYSPAGPDPTTATRNIRVRLLGQAFGRRRRLLHSYRGRRLCPAGDRLGELTREVLRRQPGGLEDLISRAVGKELLAQPVGLHRRVHVGVAQQPRDRVAEPADP